MPKPLMPKPPKPDAMPGRIRYKKPSGKLEDRPLEKIRRQFDDRREVQEGPHPPQTARTATRAKTRKG